MGVAATVDGDVGAGCVVWWICGGVGMVAMVDGDVGAGWWCWMYGVVDLWWCGCGGNSGWWC